MLLHPQRRPLFSPMPRNPCPASGVAEAAAGGGGDAAHDDQGFFGHPHHFAQRVNSQRSRPRVAGRGKDGADHNAMHRAFVLAQQAAEAVAGYGDQKPLA